MDRRINSTKIAILLGVYNGELYIKEQIESLLKQSFQDWTLYIRDDGSTDNTLKIINDFAIKIDKVVVLVDTDGNLGCNGNYFRLLSMIDSKYYMFCNADDYWFPFKIEMSYNRMLHEEEYNINKPIIVHTDLSISDKNLNIISESYWISTNTNPEKFKTYNKFGICPVVAGATMFFNKAVKDLSFPFPDFAPFFDHWISLKILDVGGVISTIHKSTISYRQIGTNLAAVLIGNENTLYSKIRSFNKVVKINIKEATMLKKIGWGGYIKYIYIKVIVIFTLRFGSNYEKEKEQFLE